MEFERLLEVVQVQRHDFLNHLQVISGLLQLNKADRVREYIGQVIAEIARMSKTARVKMPEVTAALLIYLNEAAKYQVEIDLTVNSNLSECEITGPVLGKTIGNCLEAALETMALPDIEDRRMEVIFSENERKYTCRLLFPEPALYDLRVMEKKLSPEGDFILRGGRINFAVADNMIEIFLTMPRKQGEIG